MPANPTQSDVLKGLPPQLAERIRVVSAAPVRADGDFVLYWMHHAVRSHENPALDTALRLADRTKLPVLVYQGLGGRHPYNSDRHHTFIMEGAREVQQCLRQRGIAHAFYLGRKPADPSPLKTLAQRAAVIVTEDFPAPPFPGWTRMLAQQADRAVWAVDCACLIPMRLIDRPFARAYEFRNRTQKEYEKRLLRPWEETAAAVDMFQGKLGFDAIDLAGADIAELCAQCEIDHTIPPVSHTNGGSAAGYVRWSDFKRSGLKGYGRLRNDAAVKFPLGVSRLSPYLHHGHVSPFRIARDAARDGSNGAAKFLDELLIWRELAHNFCFYRSDPETLDGLPRWARETLDRHGDDVREALYTWEILYRGQTGDALWDAAQKSLRVHGELHNNVRMTWGKAFLNWTRDPREALELMIDLNHRLALDGNDANSYGGLLWCLGLFDRPFKPERSVIGALRPRPTRDHARRLNMPAYIAKIKGPTAGEPLNVAVIGAGISGLFVARTLLDHDHRVQVFEKTARPGGRTATISVASFAFDAGAQYFTLRDDRFARVVRSWEKDGVVALWKGRIVVAKRGELSAEKRKTDRWVGVPSMRAVAAHLSAGIGVHCNVAIASVRRENGRWILTDSSGNRHGPYDVVVVAVPPPRATALLKAIPALTDRLYDIRMQPCLAVMAAFDKPLDLPFDAAFIDESPLTWVARNNSKPGRAAAECWVFHAGARWSETHADMDDKSLVRLTTEAFSESIGCGRVDPIFGVTRYWDSAAAAHPLRAGCLWDACLRIGLCGDWCQLSRMEGAALSGMAMAGRILNMAAGSKKDLEAACT